MREVPPGGDRKGPKASKQNSQDQINTPSLSRQIAAFARSAEGGGE